MRRLKRQKPQTPKGLGWEKSQGASPALSPCMSCSRGGPEVRRGQDSPTLGHNFLQGQGVRKAGFRGHFLSLRATFPSFPSLPA